MEPENKALQGTALAPVRLRASGKGLLSSVSHVPLAFSSHGQWHGTLENITLLLKAQLFLHGLYEWIHSFFFFLGNCRSLGIHPEDAIWGIQWLGFLASEWLSCGLWLGHSISRSQRWETVWLPPISRCPFRGDAVAAGLLSLREHSYLITTWGLWTIKFLLKTLYSSSVDWKTFLLKENFEASGYELIIRERYVFFTQPRSTVSRLCVM